MINADTATASSSTAAMPCTMHRLIGFSQHLCGKQIDWFLPMLHHWSLPKVAFFNFFDDMQHSKVQS